MSTIYETNAGHSAPGPYAPSAAERALFALFAPYTGTGAAMLLTADARQMFTAGAFQMQDRVAERQFGIGASGLAPVLITDTGGKPALTFGGRDPAGQLSPTANGDLANISVIAAGQEISKRPLIVPGGFSVFAKFRMPVASYGALIGSDNGGSYNAFAFGVQANTGRALLQTYVNKPTGAQPSDIVNLNDGGNYADGNIHSLICTFNATSRIATLFADGSQTAQIGNVLDVAANDITVSAPRIGATGSGTPSARDELNANLFALGWLPGPVLESATNRAIVNAWLATV